MPLYEFRCDNCGDFEKWRTLAEAGTPLLCPTCQRVAKRVFSAPMVNLNSGSLPKPKEPRRVKRSTESTTPTYGQQKNGRPWMVSH